LATNHPSGIFHQYFITEEYVDSVFDLPSSNCSSRYTCVDKDFGEQQFVYTQLSDSWWRTGQSLTLNCNKYIHLLFESLHYE